MKPSLREPLVRVIVKHPWVIASLVAMVMGVAATLVVLSGIVPIRASSGHWWITAKLLDVAKVQSVRTYSLGLDAPPFDEALMLRGAAHYAIGCELCHGGPGREVPAVMTAMTPPPPVLTKEHITRWTNEQLFTIIKHGIKFTGMPAWPAQERDDEVWAVVAFLRRMPTLQGGQYRQLAAGVATEQPPAPKVVQDLCRRCHGVDGTGRGAGAFPSLAGQRSEYIDASLRAFADRRRFSGTMSAVASSLDGATIREVASYYEGLPVRTADGSKDAEALARGEHIVTVGVPEREIPPCAECHGPSAQPKNPAYPRLMSQHQAYLSRQIQLLKERRRGGTANVTLMHAFVDRLQARDIADVTAYFSARGEWEKSLSSGALIP
jgi:cytochrome c553